MKYVVLLSLVLNFSNAHGMFQLNKAAQEGKEKIDALIKQRNYTEIDTILEKNPRWCDQLTYLKARTQASDEFKNYNLEQKKTFNNSRIISACGALVFTAISVSIFLLDYKKMFPAQVSSNIYNYCAGLFGMLGIKYTTNTLFNTAARHAYEQAGTVYAMFASKNKAIKKSHTTQEIPKQTDT